ncbi:MAG: thiamine diphosphokinase, partial [Desulfobacterales bacterium]|nr:thiamine diphosphokinase [Desulfobacterales bacterium]
MKAVIVANGVPTDSAADRKHVPPDALIIAADGGAEYCRKLDLVPDVIVGDMDSLE